MTEETMPLSEAQENLERLSEAAEESSAHVVLTASGRPQSVLIGYKAFRGLQETAELLRRPDVLKNIEMALRQEEEGLTEPWEIVEFGGEAGKVTTKASEFMKAEQY